MRYFFFLCTFLISSFTAGAAPTSPGRQHFDVRYRDYKGLHVVPGQRLSPAVFQYNTSAKKSLELVTLEWPPYIGRNICRQGWVLQSVIALLHRIGYGAKVSFYPWARALKLAESGKADILFPEYYIEPEAPSDIFPGTRRLDQLLQTEAFGWGPVAFIKRRDYDLTHYTNLDSLAGERIGVVRGYQNAPEFDRRMDAGLYKITEAKDDWQNLQLLLNKRVNLIVGDPQVIKADILGSSISELKKQAMLGQIQVVNPIIRMNGIYMVLSKRTEQVDEIVIELNQAIDSFKKYGVFSEIRYQVKQDCEGGL